MVKPEIKRYDVLKLLMVAAKRLNDKPYLTSFEDEYYHSLSLMKCCALALVIIALITFYYLQPKPMSLLFIGINTCLLLTLILYLYFIWGKRTIFPSFSLELNKDKVYPGDEVRVHFSTDGALSSIQGFTVSLVLQERIIQEYELYDTQRDHYAVYRKHDAYREILHQSSKVDITDLHFTIPKYYPPTFATKHMQMVNVKNVKKNNAFTDMSRNVNLFLEWSILIEVKAKSGALLKRYYYFNVYPFEVDQDDSKNKLEYF